DDELLYDMVVNHNVAPESVWELSDVATGAKAGREDDDKWIICMTMGMGMQDIIVANKLYENALAKGLGTKLTYWENPLWV
ncbi:MAG: ornithine cyclodeaminase, partial [Firmicutes bacterium]|nr:ornithine cyclodeaminase [Bacillota bacterium]